MSEPSVPWPPGWAPLPLPDAAALSAGRLNGLPAPAKLNLFLHVVGRRADGLHELESLFVLIDWSDTLHLQRRDDGGLSREDLSEALPPDDLCLRAARVLQQASGTPAGVHIQVDKRLPSGAGMGGGSSDAATVLLGLNQLWGLRWPRSRLAELAAGLGADVPFFIGGRNALAAGIGEQLTPVALPAQRFRVVKPAASLPTALIFTDPLLRRNTPRLRAPLPAAQRAPGVIVEGFPEGCAARPLGASAPWPDGCTQPGFGGNDLQAVAERHCPEVQQAVQALHAQLGPQGMARMTGSGSAVFGWLGSGVQAGQGAQTHPWPPGWCQRDCVLLPSHPLLAWAGA